jgi:hypothetical protein
MSGAHATANWWQSILKIVAAADFAHQGMRTSGDTFHVRAIIVVVMTLLAAERGADELVPRVSHAQAAAPPAPAKPWTFAVLSDLHLPNDHDETVRATVAALVQMRVRFVVVTGDHTNGSDAFRGKPRDWATWWPAVRDALQPLRDAGIPVLPIAGNHDTYWPWQRDAYASAFADLEAWAAPLGVQVGRAPFYYSVDVDGVHFAMAHVVGQTLSRDVATWLDEDLAAAQSANRRIVFGHVPMVSIIREPKQTFAAELGAILERGHVSHYIAGHEHVVWQERFGSIEQISVGCSSGFYQYEPSAASKLHAHCTGTRAMRCTMPDGGGAFVLARGRKNRRVQHHKNSFTLFTIDGDDLQVRPMTIERGEPRPFYL